MPAIFTHVIYVQLLFYYELHFPAMHVIFSLFVHRCYRAVAFYPLSVIAPVAAAVWPVTHIDVFDFTFIDMRNKFNISKRMHFSFSARSRAMDCAKVTAKYTQRQFVCFKSVCFLFVHSSLVIQSMKMLFDSHAVHEAFYLFFMSFERNRICLFRFN